MAKFGLKIYLLIVFSFLNVPFFGHEDLDLKINALTIKIAEDPGNGELFFERGFLYYQHEEIDNAIQDYRKSESLLYKDASLHYRFAQAYLKGNQKDSALVQISKSLVLDEHNIEVYRLQSRIYLEDEQIGKSISTYDSIFKYSTKIIVKDYLKYATLVGAYNEDLISTAIDKIDLANKTLGTPSLQLLEKKYELYSITLNEEKILTSLDALITYSNRKENWYYEKALFLFQQQKIHQARINIVLAQEYLDGLPVKMKSLKNIKESKQNIKKLNKLISLALEK